LNDIEAGKVSDELRRRGIPLRQRLRVVVESIDAEEPSVTAMTAAGGAFDWLAEEPDLYSDADLVERFARDRNCFWGILARDRSAASPSHPVFLPLTRRQAYAAAARRSRLHRRRRRGIHGHACSSKLRGAGIVSPSARISAR